MVHLGGQPGDLRGNDDGALSYVVVAPAKRVGDTRSPTLIDRNPRYWRSRRTDCGAEFA
jgi:hypothetical protein